MIVRATVLLVPMDCENIDEFNRYVKSFLKARSPGTALFISLMRDRVISLLSMPEGIPITKQTGHQLVPAEQYLESRRGKCT